MSISRGALWSARGFEPTERHLRAARSGDRGAFDSLVASYEPELRRFLQKRLPPEAIDDLLQETWLAAWTSLPSFDGRSRLKSWLYKIALFKCRDHYRAKNRGVSEVSADSLGDVWAAEEQGHLVVELRDEASHLLAALSPAQRDVLELYYFAELTLPEIARALDRNLNTVKYQFYRGHAQAAEMMKNAESKRDGVEFSSVGAEAWL